MRPTFAKNASPELRAQVDKWCDGKLRFVQQVGGWLAIAIVPDPRDFLAQPRVPFQTK
jgi:hypothetical protein